MVALVSVTAIWVRVRSVGCGRDLPVSASLHQIRHLDRLVLLPFASHSPPLVVSEIRCPGALLAKRPTPSDGRPRSDDDSTQLHHRSLRRPDADRRARSASRAPGRGCGLGRSGAGRRRAAVLTACPGARLLATRSCSATPSRGWPRSWPWSGLRHARRPALTCSRVRPDSGRARRADDARASDWFALVAFSPQRSATSSRPGSVARDGRPGGARVHARGAVRGPVSACCCSRNGSACSTGGLRGDADRNPARGACRRASTLRRLAQQPRTEPALMDAVVLALCSAALFGAMTVALRGRRSPAATDPLLWCAVHGSARARRRPRGSRDRRDCRHGRAGGHSPARRHSRAGRVPDPSSRSRDAEGPSRASATVGMAPLLGVTFPRRAPRRAAPGRRGARSDPDCGWRRRARRCDGGRPEHVKIFGLPCSRWPARSPSRFEALVSRRRRRSRRSSR